MPSDPEIPPARVAQFIRQHTHDVRNGLNSLDLEGALLQEVVTDEEGRQSVDRLRRQLRRVANELRILSARFQDPLPHRGRLAAGEILLIWREQNASLPTPLEIGWGDQIGVAAVEVDAVMLAEIFHELLSNAAAFPATGPLAVNARRDGDRLVLELCEPKKEPVDVTGWGEIPFTTTRRGAYGLGLWSARRLAEANEIRLERHFSPPGSLVTRMTLAMLQ